MRFYDDFLNYSSWQHVQPLIGIIDEMRRRRYDTRFRAGQAMATFIVSRSRKHGLRADQARITFVTGLEDCALQVVFYPGKDKSTTFKLDEAVYSDEIDTLVQKLLAFPID